MRRHCTKDSGAEQGVSNGGGCLGYRSDEPNKPYKWISYNEAISRSERFARAFISKGLAVGQKTFVGIYSQNRPEVSDFSNLGGASPGLRFGPN